MTIHEAMRFGEGLLQGSAVADPRWNAERLLLQALHVSRAATYADLQRELSDSEMQVYRGLLLRRSQGEPLAYIEGVQEFYGRDFYVDRSVLIPRPETEEIIRGALALPLPPRPGILDLGAGSGCIAATLALEIENARVVALELSTAALPVLRRNGRGRIQIVKGDLFAPPFLPNSFDLIVSNPPYVEAKDLGGLPAETRHEPFEALVAPSLETVYLSLMKAADWLLRPSGYLIFEIGAGQDSAIEELIRTQKGVSKIGSRSDFRGILRTFILHKT